MYCIIKVLSYGIFCFILYRLNPSLILVIYNNGKIVIVIVLFLIFYEYIAGGAPEFQLYIGAGPT